MVICKLFVDEVEDVDDASVNALVTYMPAAEGWSLEEKSFVKFMLRYNIHAIIVVYVPIACFYFSVCIYIYIFQSSIILLVPWSI